MLYNFIFNMNLTYFNHKDHRILMLNFVVKLELL